MKRKSEALISALIFMMYLISSCNQTSGPKAEIFFQEPQYQKIGLQTTTDTLHFPVVEKGTTAITSFNYFTHNNGEYLNVFDPHSAQITVYQFQTGNVIKTIALKTWMSGTKLSKPTIYFKNFDSIVVCNKGTLTLFDSSSRILYSAALTNNQKFSFSNETPCIFKNGIIFTNNIKAIPENSLGTVRRFQPILGVKPSQEEVAPYYHFPELYSKDYYGYSFLKYGYCINDKGNFVFSFPADTNLYETDFNNFNKGYFAKSQFQIEPISPVAKKDLENGQSFYEYSIRNSYGPVFFDPTRKWYMRVFKQKLTDSAVYAVNRIRKRSILVLDQHFKVIGEEVAPEDVDLSTLFITTDGKWFARVNNNRKPFISFVRIDYNLPEPHTTAIFRQ
jgi:hypothetical protein